MKSRLFGVALILVAIGFIAYPYASNWLNQLALNEVSWRQADAVAQAPADDLDAMWEAAERHNAALAGGRRGDGSGGGAGGGEGALGDPYAAQEGSEEYRALLNLAADGVMGSISIPSINVRIPVYHGVTDEVLTRGVGHLPQTSLPVGGASTHAVLTGHTGLPSARYFDDLERVGVGDWFVLEVLGRTLAYRVVRVDVVLPEETGSLAIERGRDLATLVTCTPYGVNSHRLLVHAERIDVPREWWDMLEGGTRPPQMLVPSATTPVWLYGLAGLALGAVAVAVVAIARRVRKRPWEGAFPGAPK